MSLEELFKKIPKPKKKAQVKSLKKMRKWVLKIHKFNQRKGCYVVSTGDVKCLDCGLVNFGHRMGCTDCSRDLKNVKKGVVWGAALNTGPIGKARGQPIIQEHVFITYKDLHERLKAGDRFYGVSEKTELTLKHFE